MAFSRSPHGERGLKLQAAHGVRVILGRSPHGERGLKSGRSGCRIVHTKSLSSWRAWIEILTCLNVVALSTCRSPHGERGLKYKDKPHLLELSLVALLMESVD